MSVGPVRYRESAYRFFDRGSMRASRSFAAVVLFCCYFSRQSFLGIVRGECVSVFPTSRGPQRCDFHINTWFQFWLKGRQQA